MSPRSAKPTLPFQDPIFSPEFSQLGHQLSPGGTRLFAQIASYYANAVADAKITQELQQYFKTSGRQFATQGTVTQERAQQLLSAWSSEGEPPGDFVIGLAFTMYRTNGYGNFICGKRLLHSVTTRQKDIMIPLIEELHLKLLEVYDIAHDYDGEKDGWMPFFGFWAEVGVRTFVKAKQFAAERFGYEEKLDKKHIVQACIAIQKLNSRHNLLVADALEAGVPSADPKIQLLQAAAQQLSQPQLFVSSIAATQRFQAHSDKTLIGLLRLRFPRTWVRWPIARRKKTKGEAE